MRDNYDFSNAKKNPFVGTFNGVYPVVIEHEGYSESVILDYTKNPPTRKIVEYIINYETPEAASEGIASDVMQSLIKLPNVGSIRLNIKSNSTPVAG